MTSQYPQVSTRPVAARPGAAAAADRRARLVLRRLDPWSVLKFSLLFYLCLMLVGLLVFAVIWFVLVNMGVFEEITKFAGNFNLTVGFPAGKVFRWYIMLGLLGEDLGTRRSVPPARPGWRRSPSRGATGPWPARPAAGSGCPRTRRRPPEGGPPGSRSARRRTAATCGRTPPAGRRAGPTAGVPEVELHRLPVLSALVLGRLVGGTADRLERRPVRWFELGDGSVRPFSLARGHIELGEHVRRERVGAGGHVHHHVLARLVDEMVEQQLDRAHLGVVAGRAQVGLLERSRRHEANALEPPLEMRADRVVLGQPEQARTNPRPGW